MDYCDIGCMLGRAPRTKETLPDFFFKYGSQYMGHNSVVSGHPKSINNSPDTTGIPWVDGLSTGPPDLGYHSMVSEHRYLPRA